MTTTRYGVRHRPTFVVLMGLATAIVLSAAPACGQFAGGPNFRGLGLGFRATAISANGSVVVGFVDSAGGNFEAARWTRPVGIETLGALSNEIRHSSAFGVSASGATIVGGSQSDSGFEAFRWTRTGGMQGLGDLDGGDFNSHARAISANGSVIVGVGTSAAGEQAFRWTQSGGMQGLGDLSGGDFDSYATAVSANGSVVVGTGSSSNSSSGQAKQEAFRWTAGGGMQGLGDLGAFVGEDTWSQAADVSGDGSVVVGTSYYRGYLYDDLGRLVSINADLGPRAFIWEESRPDDMFTPDVWGRPGSSSLNAISANSHGHLSVSVGSRYAPAAPAFARDGEHATLYDHNFVQTFTLHTRLQSKYGVNLAGWKLLSATDISADGKTIIGRGIKNGRSEDWIVTLIPQPSETPPGDPWSGGSPGSPPDIWLVCDDYNNPDDCHYDGPGLSSTASSVTVGGSENPDQMAVLHLNPSGPLTVTNGVVVLEGGGISGNGRITGEVSNRGLISPGDSPGLIEIIGHYTQTGTLKIELGGAAFPGEYDRLQISGPAMLGGSIDVSLIDPPGGADLFDPPPGAFFDILLAQEIADIGVEVSVPVLSRNRRFGWFIAQHDSHQSLRLTVVPEPATLVLIHLGALALFACRRVVAR